MHISNSFTICWRHRSSCYNMLRRVTREMQLLLCLYGSSVQDHFMVVQAKVVCTNASHSFSLLTEFSCVIFILRAFCDLWMLVSSGVEQIGKRLGCWHHSVICYSWYWYRWQAAWRQSSSLNMNIYNACIPCSADDTVLLYFIFIITIYDYLITVKLLENLLELNLMNILYCKILYMLSLQCFVAVGWATGRASGL